MEILKDIAAVLVFPALYLLSGYHRVGYQLNGYAEECLMVAQGRTGRAMLFLPLRPLIDGTVGGKPLRLLWFVMRWSWVAWCVFTPWTWWKVAALVPVAVSMHTSALE